MVLSHGNIIKVQVKQECLQYIDDVNILNQFLQTTGMFSTYAGDGFMADYRVNIT